MTTHKNQHFLRRLRFALDGLSHTLRTERSFQTQAVLFVVVIVAMLLVRPGPIWWAAVALACSGVLGAELFNTAIEHLADHLHPDIHPQIRMVKDCAAAAVLIASLGAVGVAMALVAHLVIK